MSNFSIKDELKIVIGIDLLRDCYGEVGLYIDVLGFLWNLEVSDGHIQIGLCIALLPIPDFFEIGTGKFRVILDEFFPECLRGVQLSSNVD